MHSSEVFLWSREILMSRQHQVRPLSPGILYNCCQPQPEMCVMNLEVKSTAGFSPAASQVNRAERHGCTCLEGTGKKVTLCHPLQSAQAAATPAPKPSDAVIPHSKAGELLSQHFPTRRSGSWETRQMCKGTGQQHRRCRGQEKASHPVSCFAGAEAGLGAKQWVGSAWPLHALPFLSPCPMLSLFPTFQYASKYLFSD